MVFELTAVEEQRVEDLMEAFGWADFAARQQVMFEAGFPVVCDLIPIDAACVVCGQPIGDGVVFYQDDGPTPYCRRHGDLEVRRLTGGRGL